MTRFMLYGGFLGFLLVFSSGLMIHRELNETLRDAMVGCFLMAYLSKLFYRRLEACAVAVLEKDAAAAEADRQARKAEERGK